MSGSADILLASAIAIAILMFSMWLLSLALKMPPLSTLFGALVLLWLRGSPIALPTVMNHAGGY